jgi:acyl dehydratase
MAFIRGLGGFNYPGKGIIKPNPSTPQRKPDYTLSGSTFPNQAFVYRLCFDMNPLHIVPSIAKSQNFERPILHGKTFK